MKKLVCSSCGSGSLVFEEGFYTCSHCQSVYRAKRLKNRVKKHLYFSFLALNLIALIYYFGFYQPIEPSIPIKITKIDKVIKQETTLPKEKSVEVKTDTPKAIKPKISLSNMKIIKNIDIVSKYRGRGAREIMLSKDKQYLYAITGESGFKIFQKQESKGFIEIGDFVHKKRRTTFRINEPKEERAKYDSPTHFQISKDEKRAYISDKYKGFYILDIEDKTKPKLLGQIESLKIHSFIISLDETRMVTYYHRRLLDIDIHNPKVFSRDDSSWNKSIKENHVYSMYRLRDIVFIADGSLIIVYSLSKNRQIDTYKASSIIRKVVVSRDNKILYALSFFSGIERINIGEDNRLSQNSILAFNGIYSYFDIDKKEETLYLADIKGLKVFDIKENKLLNPRIYVSSTHSFVNTFILDEEAKEIILAFSIFPAFGVLTL